MKHSSLHRIAVLPGQQIASTCKKTYYLAATLLFNDSAHLINQFPCRTTVQGKPLRVRGHAQEWM